MKRLIYLILLVFSNTLFAKNIVLLTSLPNKDIKFTRDIGARFIQYTKDFYRQGFKIYIVHQADAQKLHSVLNNPQTHAIFWLSHGGAAKSQSPGGMQASASLLDYNGDNVAKVFQRIHPNIKFVGIMGCNSNIIMQGLLPKRDDLHTYFPKGKITAHKALKVSTRTFRYFYHRNTNKNLSAPAIKLGYKVMIHRKTGGEFNSYKPVQVFLGANLLTVLPKMPANSERIFKVMIPFQQQYTKSDLKFLLTTGQSAFDSNDYFGDIAIQVDNNQVWKLFAKPDGTPFGVNVRIFHDKFGSEFPYAPSRYINFNTEKNNG